MADDRAGADDRSIAQCHAVQYLGAGAEPGSTPDIDTCRPPHLVEHRHIRIAEVMISTNEVAVRREQRAGTDADAACGEQLAIEADVRAVLDGDVTVLAR